MKCQRFPVAASPFKYMKILSRTRATDNKQLPMLIKSLYRVVAKVSGKPTLQTALIVPFVLQIVGAVWLIGYLVVIVPEADFMQQIKANTHMRILLCIAAFIVATGIGIMTALFQPIFDEDGKVEFLILEGRNITGREQAQKILADYNRTLEAQVAERTAELIHINEQLKREIDKRKAAELTLQQQKETLQTICDNIPVMLSFYNASLEVQPINKAFERTLGWSLEELREIDILAQCYPDPGYRAKVTEFMMRADGTWQDFQMVTRSGNTLFTSWANIRLPDGSTVGIGKDITACKQIEEALQESALREQASALTLDELKRTQSQLIQTEKMSILGKIVAGIAHEINNPISFIYGNLTPARHYFQELLNLLALYQQTYPQPTPEIQQLESEFEIDFLVEDCQRLIDSMQVGAERIREIVLSLRNFSRLDERELKAVDIHQGIDSTLLILQHKLKAKGNRSEIEVIKNYGQLPLVTCYVSQLNQVFMHLFDNAIDALETQTPPRVITISTSLNQNSVGADGSIPGLCQEEAAACPISDWVVIRIADNGTGMSEAVKKKIFDPFFTTKPVGSGTGLGLSTSYQIVVEKHKGKISCISAPGKGTEFIVEIPVSQKDLVL